jgi:hypothetical protein
MKYKNLFVSVIVSILLFFVSSCTVQSDVGQGSEKSVQIDAANSKDSAQAVSAWYFTKMNKAASNLSWAATVKMAVVSQRNKWDPYIDQEVYQGDISAKYYNGNRNAKPYDYFEMRDNVRLSLDYYGAPGSHGTPIVPGAADVYSNLFWKVLYCGVPIVVVRRDKTNYKNFWAVIIFAMPNTKRGQETISVYDPEHGFDYTCDLKGFCDDAKYYDGNSGQFALWPKYGPAGGVLPSDAAYTPAGTY